MQGVSVGEIKEHRDKLAEQIAALVVEFEQKNGVSITENGILFVRVDAWRKVYITLDYEKTPYFGTRQ